MKTFLIIAGTAVATIIVVCIGFRVTGSHWGGHHGGQHYANHSGSGGHGPGMGHRYMRGGQMRGMGFGGADHACQGGGLDRIESVVENFVSFTPEQDAAWKNLSAAMRAAHAERQAACETMRADDMRDGGKGDEQREQARPATAPDRLARMESRLEAGVAAVRGIRPALDAFYATLNEDQREALDEMMGHRHRRHGRMWR
ncbi:MAG: Spy/CpxP family protein refolding chaperone [Alphaproteobacteria bacterium]